MTVDMPAAQGCRLERSCGASLRDYIRTAPSRPGLERIEALFAGHAYDPHRHDTYAIGYTLAGVQSFEYRGARFDSLPGDTIVVHPDERHDGRAGTEAGFRYRMVYVEPSLVLAALGPGARALPFSSSAVQRDARLIAALRIVLGDLGCEVDDLQANSFLVEIADILCGRDPSAAMPRPPARATDAIWRAADYLHESADSVVRSADLENITGLDRFTLSRQFRSLLGTSPYRYLTMRRLDRVRWMIRSGSSLADAALDAGFTDQSHMTRHFKRTYGVSPGAWRSLVHSGMV
jgi:AraC-like DNA-binding protein